MENTTATTNARMLAMSIETLASEERQLKDAIERLTGSIASLNRRVENGSSLNPLGELQGTAPQVDAAVGRVTAARKAAEMMIEAIGSDCLLDESAEMERAWVLRNCNGSEQVREAFAWIERKAALEAAR